MLCSNCQTVIEKEEWYECDKCGKEVCVNCSDIISDEIAEVKKPLIFKVDQMWYKWIDDNYPDKNICMDCKIEIEKEFLMNLSSEELPLFINEKWVNDDCLELYKKLLSGMQ